MTRRFTTRLHGCWRRRRALTLVEVVAGLTLLATLTAGVLMAFGVHQRQTRIAGQRLAATAAADHLLASWYQAGRRGPPWPAAGATRYQNDRYFYRTRRVEQVRVEGLAMNVIRLELFDDSPETRGKPPIVQVELLAPDPTDEFRLRQWLEQSEGRGSFFRRNPPGSRRPGATP